MSTSTGFWAKRRKMSSTTSATAWRGSSGAARELYGRSFQTLDLEKQTAILTRISDRKTLQPDDERGNRFFLDIRSRVVFSYYTSEAGLMKELTYKGKQMLEHWEGCPHPDRHGDSE